MTVYENITFGLENLKWPKDKIQERAATLMKMLKITEYGDRYPSELSGGQQQRVAIARTLATGPKTLFMDEPLSNLDAKLRMEMRTELKRLHMETDSTFVYVTHDQLEAMTLSTKICLIKEGLLQQYAPPLTVYNQPANTFVADFIGSPNINLLPVKVKSVEDKTATLILHDKTVQFTSTEPLNLTAGQDLVLGIRPENVVLDPSGELVAQIYSTLPSGMETVVRLKLNGLNLTEVVFGSVDFKVNEEVHIKIKSDKNLLFAGDKEGKCLTQGSIY
jgi:multiple sugar transport system ATP-binding protein